MPQTLPLASVKAKLSELIDIVQKQQERVVVTRNGRPAAVLISPDELESLEETLEILSDPSLKQQLRQAQREIARGDYVTLDQLKARRKRAG